MTNTEKMLNESATNAYNCIKKAIAAWEKTNFFHQEKYYPDVYRLFTEIDTLQNRTIAIGDAEITRCTAIMVLSGKIFEIIDATKNTIF